MKTLKIQPGNHPKQWTAWRQDCQRLADITCQKSRARAAQTPSSTAAAGETSLLPGVARYEDVEIGILLRRRLKYYVWHDRR